MKENWFSIWWSMPEEIKKLSHKTLKIHVRQLESVDSDINRVIEIENLSFNQFDGYIKTDFMRWLGFNPNLCLVAEIGGQIAGDIISRILDDKVELASLAIHPDYRRQGVGAALMEETARRARAYGIGAIDLEVRKTNTAGINFWIKMGFSPVGEQPGFYEDGETALQMRKNL